MGEEQLGHEVNQSALSSAMVYKAWSYTSTYPSIFMALCFVKHQGQLFFTFTLKL
jgi:hypothetical protein